METRFLDQKTEMEKCEEGYRNFDLKPLTEEEVAWLEEHFVREQYLVRQDDIREALKKLEGLTLKIIKKQGELDEMTKMERK